MAGGEVTLVFLHIGANDFLRERYEEIYDGSVSDKALAQKVTDVVADVTTAIDTVRRAGSAAFVMTDVGQRSDNHEESQ